MPLDTPSSPRSPARRAVLTGLASLPLAAVLADPRLAAAAAMGLEDVSLTLPGGGSVSAALAMPETTPAPTVLLIHEWWGLNDQIKAVAADFAKQGYIALAADLYGGEVASTPDQAKALMGAVEAGVAAETLVAWAEWLKADEKSTGKIGTVGWCFGGGWSLNASLATPVDATVVYYGRVAKSAAELASLESPVLGHFATQDGWINQEMVDGFTAAMDQAGKSYTVHWYEADHAFANPSGGRYDEADAKLAWERTTAFFEERLKG
ncbi:MAG: dienelactone hydrolase family protein [Rhodovibrionaceae bacterium]